MKSLSDIDPNFRLPETIPEGMRLYAPNDPPFSIYGVAPNRRGVLCRLPEAFLPQCSEGVQRLAYHLAGACVRFSTDSDQFAVVWELTETSNMPHFAASGQSGLDLFEETDTGTRHVKSIIPALDNGCGCHKKQSAYIPLPGGLRHYALYLPLYNGLTQLLLGFPQGARIAPGRKPKIEKPIVFYGSSITQGACASKAGSAYTTLLCRRLDAAQINLGFSGNGKGEAHMARYIAGLDMRMFVFDYDHNALSPEDLEKTHEPFFRIVRAAHPELPVVLISRPDFDGNPQDSALRREVIRKTYMHALAEGDQHVVFVDGQMLYGQTDRDMCSVDGIHPCDLGFWRMAEALEPVLRKCLNP